MSDRVRCWRIVGGLALLAAGAAQAAPTPGPRTSPLRRPYARALEHRPSPVPDRIILTWAGDPARSQAVTWRTDDRVWTAVAQLAVAEDNRKLEKKARTVRATSTPLRTDLGGATYHTARFEGLEPKTKYAYRVGDGANWSEWAHFTTAGDRPEPFSFLYFGDAQNDLKAHWSRVVREAYSDAPKARFLVHAGDLINRANADAEWGEWFSAGGWLNATVPSVPAPGNHEYEGRKDEKTGERTKHLSRHWRPQFALPEHGPSGLEETVYYLDYQGVRVVALNSNEGMDRQAAWMEQVLADNPNRWTVVAFHHPIYSPAKKRDNPTLRRLWQPVFDKFKVDLVLTGHDHSYARSGLMLSEENAPTGASVRDPSSGTVYVVSVSGPKLYELNPQGWMRNSAADTQLYQVIHVDGGRLRYEARTATGRLHDRFELRKRPGGVNELAEAEQLAAEASRADWLNLTNGLAAAVAVLGGVTVWALARARRAARPAGA
jgi:3',5'-cyclic AMP phosphodiesterase CpdA